jgi:iron complex transport system substrate-binding protein
LRIVSLEPFITDIIDFSGAAPMLVGVSSRCELSEPSSAPTIVTIPDDGTHRFTSSDEERISRGLATSLVDCKKIISLSPDIIFTRMTDLERAAFQLLAEEYFEAWVGRKVLVKDVSIISLATMYEEIEAVGVRVGKGRECRDLAGRIKAQIMGWADSFFDRSRGKKVVLLSSIEPLRIETRWFTSFAKLFSCQLFTRDPKRRDSQLQWSEICDFRPDVILVAPQEGGVATGVRGLGALERLDGWDSLPAVKRGDVFFCDGNDLYRPGPRFLKGAAVFVSALAGLESGYITQRDEFYRLRFLELHRHRFLC